MIVLDTHIWIWWVDGNPRLSKAHAEIISAHESTGLGVSVLSCWEVAKLVSLGRLALNLRVPEWIRLGLSYPGIRLLDFTPEIAIAATHLPPPFHRDPADQIIVATARVLAAPILSADSKIDAYPHVEKAMA